MDLFERLRRHPAYWYMVAAAWAVVALVLFFQTGYLRKNYAYGSPGTTDFIEYWSAGQLLRRDENPYDAGKLHDLQLELGLHPPSEWPSGLPIIMWNPPWLLVWIYPLLWLPFLTAAQVWIFVNGLLILLGTSLIWLSLNPKKERKPLGFAWVAATLFVPTLLTLRMGQMSGLMLVGVAGFLYFACRNYDFLAGTCLALTTIKPHVVYLVWIAVIGWVILERRWKVVAGGAAALLPTLGILTALWPGWLPAYRTATANAPLYWQTASMGGILRLFLLDEAPWGQFLPPLLGCVGLAIYWLKCRPPFQWQSDLGPLLLVSVPTAAYGWAYDQLLLMVPYLTIIFWLLQSGQLTVKHKVVALAGLVLIAAGMVTENLYGISEVFFFWPPCVLGAIYLYVWHARRSAPAPATAC
jgi:hypothetical protein